MREREREKKSTYMRCRVLYKKAIVHLFTKKEKKRKNCCCAASENKCFAFSHCTTCDGTTSKQTEKRCSEKHKFKQFTIILSKFFLSRTRLLAFRRKNTFSFFRRSSLTESMSIHHVQRTFLVVFVYSHHLFFFFFSLVPTEHADLEGQIAILNAHDVRESDLIRSS